MKKPGILASICLTVIITSALTAYKSREHTNTNSFTTAKRTEAGATPSPNAAEPRTYKIKLGNDQNNLVQIEVYRSSVRVVGHNADEVVIQADNYEAPERAEGLRSLFSQAEDNTKLGLAVNQENNTLHIIQANRRGGEYTIKVPKNVTVVYHEASPHGGNFELADTNGEIDLKLHHASATLTNVTGPVKANTLHGHLNITFSQLNQAKASAITSVHGPVDITLPGNTKADLELEANHGEIYTDFEINRPSDSKNGLTKIAGGNTIKGKTNNGGVEMSVSAVHSDIFIRRQK